MGTESPLPFPSMHFVSLERSREQTNYLVRAQCSGTVSAPRAGQTTYVQPGLRRSAQGRVAHERTEGSSSATEETPPRPREGESLCGTGYLPRWSCELLLGKQAKAEVVCELRSCVVFNATLCCPLKKVLHHTNSIT